jgi:PleD family two-component response regulator
MLILSDLFEEIPVPDSKDANNYNSGHVVLVADQDRNDNRVLCRFLEKQGYGTVPVFEFQTLQKLLSDFTPDLIVLDALFERSQEIVDITRSRDRTARIPIIMIRNKHRAGSFTMPYAN